MGARDHTRGEPVGPADDELIREVRHAAGNLVQRIQYWTVLLEDEMPAGNAAQQSLVSLRTSLDCLHRLMVRSLDLLRTTESRPIAIAIGDIVTAFALRFGGAAAIKAQSTEAMTGDAAVDPLLLERALALLSEVLAADGDATNGRAVITVTREPATAGDVRLTLRAAWRGSDADPFARVQARLALALAIKLFDSSRFVTHVDENEQGVELRVDVPLHTDVQRDDASTHSARPRDSRESLPL